MGHAEAQTLEHEVVSSKPPDFQHCRQIRARAQDLLDGRSGVIEAARA